MKQYRKVFFLVVLAFLVTFVASGTTSAQTTDISINEIRIDQPSTDNDEYFELAGNAGASLDGLTYLVIGDGASADGSGVIENVTDLSGQTIGSTGFFVAAESSFTLGSADLVTGLNFENSDNVTHLLVAGFSGASGDDLDVDDDGTLDVTPWTEMLDLIALVEEENPPSSTEYHYGPPSVGPDGFFVPGHAYLCEDGWRIGEFGGGDDTPGAENACEDVGPVEAKIHDVQGSGSSVAITDPVLVEAIVVGDFQAGDELSAFFIQEEDADVDGDPNTSEGIMVYCGSCSTDVAVGDLVQVTGEPEEFFSMSQIDATVNFGDVSIVSSGNDLPTVTEITLPVASFDALEKYEGMYVTFPQELVISEFFNFDRFGEIVLTTERQFQPTATYDPGSPEAAQEALDNALSRITLDDGRDIQNPDPAIHPNGADFTLTNTFRGGDIVQNATGVLQYAFGRYRLHPTEGADYAAANPRPASPDDVGGNLKVAAFNVLNYFHTLDDGSDICGPLQDQGCRGADNEEERTRQLDKIVSAMVDIEADVLGIIEVENTAGVEAMADIVDGLNDAFGPDTYAYVDTGTVGTDAIKVGFIYRTTKVSLVGDFAVLDTPEFLDPNDLGDDKNRAALAQTFIDNETGGVFTAVVNHLKSKGSPCGPGDDDPEAGSCNLTRTLAAQELADWLATDPTGSGDSDFLIIGDLNAYDKEDPIDTLRANGYTDLVFDYQGEFAYSFVFDGQLGYLDYGMANADLAEEVTGTTVWHINADEPDIIDYDTTFKRDAQDALYEPNAFRSSDHDPVIVGLNLVCEDETAPTLSVTMSPDTLWPPNHQYVTVSPNITVNDNINALIEVNLLSVTPNEPDNGLGDGDMPNDIVINDDGTVDVRAERSGTGDGRVYTFVYEAVDACGNSTIATATVTVPLSQAGGRDR